MSDELCSTIIIPVINNVFKDFSLKWIHSVEGDSLPSSPEGSDDDDEPKKDTSTEDDDEV